MITLFKIRVTGRFGGAKMSSDGTIIDNSVTNEYSVVAYKKEQAIKRAEKEFKSDCADLIKEGCGGYSTKTEVIDEQVVLIW